VSPRLAPLALPALLALAACGSTEPARTFTLADGGHVVTLKRGQQAVVKLETLEWTFHPPLGGAVRELGPERLVFLKSCSYLAGCGSVALTIGAVERGRSTIIATRRSCGEDARCLPDQMVYTLGIVVR
jgi:hypothetical protein